MGQKTNPIGFRLGISKQWNSRYYAGRELPALLREDELLRDPEAADARESLRAAPAGDDAEVDLRLAESRLARCVADVAAERELAAAAEREAVDRGDRRLRHRLEQPADLVAERSPRLRADWIEP